MGTVAGVSLDGTRRWSSGREWVSEPTERLPPSAPLPPALQTLAFWRDPHAYLEWCRGRYGDRFTVQAVRMAPLVFFSKPADIKRIARAPVELVDAGAGGAVIAPIVGEGSFMLAEEDVHLRGRRAGLTAFQRRKLEGHADAVLAIVEREIASWPVDTPMALHPYLRALALRVILTTTFGEDPVVQGELHGALLEMLSINASLALQEPQLRSLPPWRGIWRRFLRAKSSVDGILYALIDRRVGGLGSGSGLLDRLIAASSNAGEPDVEQVRDDLMSMILAGHETTASELAWAFQLLAHNPKVMSSLQGTLDEDDEQYLAATLHEVLRHRPVFLFAIPRVVRSAIEIAGTVYEPPVQLVGCIHLMHHDPTLFAEPDRFRPERFLESDSSSAVWMPWGGGRKRCPGYLLALMEMKAVLRTALSRFHVLPASRKLETARWRSVIVTPENGCRIVLRRRFAA
jgi:cytochrome P450